MNMIAKQKRVGKLRTFFQRSRAENGVAAVEMAIILPLLMVILFGIINFGTVFYNYIVLTNAAREGARWGSINTVATAPNPSLCSGSSTTGTPLNPCIVTNRQAQDLLISYGTPTNTSTTAAITEGTDPDTYVLTVTVHSDYGGIGYFKSFFSDGLTGTARMYLEPAE